MIRLTPLGGLGEVGLNCMLVDAGEHRIMIDCGVTFPRANLPGVDIIVPDFRHVFADKHRLRAVVLTHGHEDHIGALAWLLRNVSVPIYATPLTAAFVKERFEEMGTRADVRLMEPSSRLDIARDFSVEPFAVRHSIPDAVGLVVKWKNLTLIHTGDFKFDTWRAGRTPGATVDFFRELGDRGVTCLLSDSTNVEVHGSTTSEGVVEESFERHIQEAPGRIVAVFFASHLARVQHLLETCAKFGRKVVVMGRSFERNVRLGLETGRLKPPKGVLVDESLLGKIPYPELVLAVTGSQGEPRAVLANMALNPTAANKIEPNDTVLFAARAIPGNEAAVNDIVNQCFARGARVFYPTIDPTLHVSGHASRDDLVATLRAVRPRVLVPVHGELKHLALHAQVAREAGVAGLQPHLTRNGDLLDVSVDGARRFGHIDTGRLFYRREAERPTDQGTIDARRAIAEGGAVSVAVVFDRRTTRVVAGPHLSTAGLSTDAQSVAELAGENALKTILDLREGERRDDVTAAEAVRHTVRRTFRQLAGVVPATLVNIVRVDLAGR